MHFELVPPKMLMLMVMFSHGEKPLTSASQRKTWWSMFAGWSRVDFRSNGNAFKLTSMIAHNAVDLNKNH